MILIKHRMFIGIALVLLVFMGAACSGPEEKKIKFYNKGKMLYDKGDLINAKLEIKNAIQIDPKYTDAYYMLGMVALKSMNPRGAYGSFSKVIELSPEHSGAHVQIGWFLLGAGETDEAMSKASFVLKNDEKNEDALLLKIAILIKKEDTKGARSLLESVIGQEIRKPEGYLYLAALYTEEGEKHKAEKTLVEGIRNNEKSVRLYLVLADYYLRQKRTDEAIEIMKKVISIEPDLPLHSIALAGMYWNSGKEQAAEEVLKSLVSGDPKNEERWVQTANFYAARKKTEEAEKQLKAGIGMNEKSFRLRFALSAFYLSNNRPDQAVAVLEEALELERDGANPDIIHTKNSLAQFYLSHHQVEKAKKYVDEVIKESPGNVDANYIKGVIHLSRGEGLQAVSVFRTVVNERPEFIPGYISLADAHAINNEPKLALNTLEEALKIAPDSRDVLRAMGQQYEFQKDLTNAEAQYREILDAHAKDLEVRADLGDLMMRSGDFRRAEKEYAEVKRQAPDYPIGYVKTTAVYMAQKKYAKAISELEQVVQMHPKRWSAANDLAYLLSEYGKGKKDLDRALVLAEKAKSLSPDNSSVFDTLGWVHYQRDEAPQAIEWLAKAQTINAGKTIVNYHLGMAYFLEGNTEKAKEYLEIALASRVAFPGKDEAKRVFTALSERENGSIGSQ